MNFTQQEIEQKLKQLFAQLDIKRKQSDILLTEIEAILIECLSLQEYKQNFINGQSKDK